MGREYLKKNNQLLTNQESAKLIKLISYSIDRYLLSCEGTGTGYPSLYFS